MPARCSPCVHASGMIVSGISPASSRRSWVKSLPNRAPIAANATCETDSEPLPLVLFLNVITSHVARFWNTGCAENGARNVLERSASGGQNHGADASGALHSPKQVDPLLEGHGLKRKRGEDPARPSRSVSIKQPGRTFACPYYLHDRIRHSDCLNIRLIRLSDVRQHLLERAHYQPVHCPVCGVVFQGRLADARRLRDLHIRARTCERSPVPFNYPGITEDGEQRIRDIARHNRTSQVTEVQRWYLIWDFLFPGEQRPDSPFLNDSPEFQRVFDWSSTIFDNDLWMVLPIEPWTTAMDLEQRRAGMVYFINRFVALARGVVAQDTSPVVDQHQADNSSYTGVSAPAPPTESANLEVAPRASANVATEASRPAYLSPARVTGTQETRGSRELNRTEPSTRNLAAAGPPIPFRPPNGHSLGVLQEVQQPARPEGAAVIQHDPIIPSVATEGFSFNVPAIDDAWLDSILSNEDAGVDHNLNRHGDEDLGRD